MNKALITTAILALAISAAASSYGNAPCIPDGGTDTICVAMKLTGRQSMSAEAMEEDRLSDDDVGEATITSPRPGLYEACVTITNSGGDLYGPNNEIQNTGTEGDCIEVYLVVHIVSPLEVELSGGLIGGSVSTTAAGEATTAPKTFCPC